jgi:hypothetical protein
MEFFISKICKEISFKEKKISFEEKKTIEKKIKKITPTFEEIKKIKKEHKLNSEKLILFSIAAQNVDLTCLRNFFVHQYEDFYQPFIYFFFF